MIGLKSNDHFSAAKSFVESYYIALQSARATIESFYTAEATTTDGTSLPIIVFNGNPIPGGAAMQKIFDEMPPAKYGVQCYDCQVINPNFVTEKCQDKANKSVRNMSILVSVSGYVKFREPREAEMRTFSETFILVPNSATVGGDERRNQKEWLIQSQTFRFVVL